MADLEKIYEEIDSLGKEQIMDIMTKLIGVDTIVPPGNTYRE